MTADSPNLLTMSSDTVPLARSLLNITPEILLHIFSYLDLPDLACLAQLSPHLARLASDPALHRVRLLVVTPSRVSHSLFALGPQGVALRPTVGDLVHRGVMRGPGIERKWRMGLYFYSTLSVKQFETGLRLQRRYTSTIISSNLSRRSSGSGALKSLHQSQILPDIEGSSLFISRSLLPVMRQLKWSIQRDRLSKMVRDQAHRTVGGKDATGSTLAAWFEANGSGIVNDGERVRLALCPGVKKIIGFYEKLSH